MVAAPDNRDLSNKEKEHTHTYSTERKKKNDGQIKKTAKRVTDSRLPCYGAIGIVRLTVIKSVNKTCLKYV